MESPMVVFDATKSKELIEKKLQHAKRHGQTIRSSTERLKRLRSSPTN